MAIRGLAKYVPALAYGTKIYPEHIAGLLGLPEVGNIWYVDPSKSVSGGGTTRGDAFKTLTEALAAATADNDDVVIIAGKSSTGRTSEAAAIDWNKRRTHIIGNGAPRRLNSRNGVSFASTVVSPCFTVSTNNCIFANISFAVFEDINVLVNVTGNYNTFMNVHFQGIGNATAGDDAAARSLVLTGAEENEFINCTIGLDTVTRGGAANASLELTGSCPRNKFINCDFPIFTDGAEPTWVKADTGNCYERFLQFENCFFNNPDGSSSTTLTIGMDLSTTGNGDINLINCNYRGATDLANNYTRLFTNSPVVDTANQGLMVVQAT
jgi:hypothetical protein